MRRSSWLSLIFCLPVLADQTPSSKTVKPPEPLSELNLEDFQSAVRESEGIDSNPFVKNGDAPQAKQMQLLGIVHRPGGSLALINSEVVKVGDKIGASTVIAIEKHKVVLRNEDGLFQITMKGQQNEKT